MTPYEKMISIIRKEGNKGNEKTVILGEMISRTSCKVNGITLTKEDLYYAQHLVEHDEEFDIKSNDTVTSRTSSAGDPAHTHTLENFTTKKTMAKQYTSLKKGDVVALCRISEEKYLVLEKVVTM